MARKPSGFGKPKLKRTEPREIGPSSAALELPQPSPEQVRPDNSAAPAAWQSDNPAISGGFPPVEPRRLRRGPRTVLTDRQWDNARRCVLGERGKPGRNAQNNRMKLEGMLWIFRVGAPWRDLPAEFGDWSNVCHTFRRWAAWGVFLLMFLALASARNVTSAW